MELFDNKLYTLYNCTVMLMCLCDEIFRVCLPSHHTEFYRISDTLIIVVPTFNTCWVSASDVLLDTVELSWNMTSL